MPSALTGLVRAIAVHAARIILLAAIVAGSAAARASVPPRVVAIPGTEVAVKLWEERGVPHYAIALDGRTFAAPRATSYDIALVHGAFDPLGAALHPAVDGAFAAGDDVGLHIVQFVTQPLPEYRAAIAGLGGMVFSFIAHHAHVVRMDAATRDAVAALPYVRWVGPYHPAYRLEPFLLANASVAEAVYPLQRYNVMLFDPQQATKRAVADRVRALGGVVEMEHAGKYLLEATLTPAQLFAVVRWDEVAYVDRWGPFEADMNIGREIGGANFVEGVEGFSGEGVRGEVIDIGFNVEHADFQAKPLLLHTAIATADHGASTSGIIFGDGSANPPGQPETRGLVPDAQGIVASSSVMEGQPRYDHTAELVSDPWFAVFQSASVGSPLTTQYSTISAEIDAMLFDFDIVHCQSQSNNSNQFSRPQAWAKNIVAVGGVRHWNTLDRADDSWGGGTSAASHGPAADGRVKPDLCHFYDNIRTVTYPGATSYTDTFGGTSGATPIVAGHVGLLFQMWSQSVFQNPVDPLGTVFENRCHMATAKALIINTARPYDWTLGGPNADIDRFKQGWGLPDVQTMYELRNKMVIVDEDDLIMNLGANLYTVEVDPGEPALRATLVYTDPPGVPSSSVHRVNDLSLKVTAPGGQIYWGNNGLASGIWSTPGGAPNEIDTVENVFVQNPAAGLWSVEVIAFELNDDGHPETFSVLDADYALVVSGVRETLPPLTVRVPLPPPALVPPGTPLEIAVEVLAGAEAVIPGSELVHYRFDAGDAFTSAPMQDQGGGDFLATIPGAPCDSAPQFYFSAQGDGGTVVTNPPSAPAAAYGFEVGEFIASYDDDFETDLGWTVINESLADGQWDRGVPVGGGDRGDPPTDYDGSGKCWLTDNVDDNSDVDGGPTRLISPILDATALPDPVVTYARWFSNDDQDIDRMVVEISNNAGGTWTQLESAAHDPIWRVKSFRIADFIAPTAAMRLRFSVTDNPNDSVTEAGLDAVRIDSFVCEDPSVPGDVDGDLDVDFEDLLILLASWGPCPAPPAPCPADVDGDGSVGFGDLLLVLANWS